jgi:Protein-glutamine gamma-glutamyltransferase
MKPALKSTHHALCGIALPEPGLCAALTRIAAGTLQALLLYCVALATTAAPTDRPAEGLQFSCEASHAHAFKSELAGYFESLGITNDLLESREDVNGSSAILSYVLKGPDVNSDTLDISKNPRFSAPSEWVSLPGRGELDQLREVASRKEIVLALLHPGRLTRLGPANCSVSALKDHVGTRQNIVAWASQLEWQWPEGEFARWNEQFWNSGTPRIDVPLHVALHDAFVNQNAYAIGCFAATKLVIAQGVLDYYRRVKPDISMAQAVERRLLSDHEPLVNVEPGEMWSFEPDFNPEELPRQGKLVELVRNVAPLNFVPGDWVYILNTDSKTYQKRGYEGSNAIYLGQGKFDDFYNDNEHAYTLLQKLDEVYQWRNGVFSRTNDAEKIKPLSRRELELLAGPPKAGGLVLSYRAIPRLSEPSSDAQTQ